LAIFEIIRIMVYYIVACHKEDKNEQEVEQIVKTQVLKDNNGRDIGKCFSLT